MSCSIPTASTNQSNFVDIGCCDLNHKFAAMARICLKNQTARLCLNVIHLTANPLEIKQTVYLASIVLLCFLLPSANVDNPRNFAKSVT